MHIPPNGTHTCLLASVITRSDRPIAGRHVWEHNNLAQKNLMVVDLEPYMFIVLPIVVRNWRLRFDPRFDLEIWKPEAAEDISVSLIHRSKEFFKDSKADAQALQARIFESNIETKSFPARMRLGSSDAERGRPGAAIDVRSS